ncbi:MAG: hypothetical protein JWQ78_1501 [Sediminibacterium sp.]|nr:hypothetical protein [Sediminibacterium sp.]
MATKIIVNRKSAWLNRIQKIRVLIDGAESGTVANGNSEQFIVEPGTHTVECKIKWYSSPVLTVALQEGETKYLKVGSGLPYYFPLYLLVLLSLLLRVGLQLAHIPAPDYLTWIQVAMFMPFILYILYYFTIGKKQYLVLEEDKENMFS